MTRVLNLDKISKLTERKIRKEVGVRTTKQLITLANKSGYEVTTPNDAFRVFGSIYNERVMDERAKKKEQRKATRKTERDRIIELRKNVTVIENTDHDTVSKIRKNLSCRKGQNLVGVFIVNKEEYKTHEFTIPTNGFSSWWKVVSREFWIDSGCSYFDQALTYVDDKGTFYIYPQSKSITTKFITQNFKDGVTNCMLTPIRTWATELFEGAKTKQTKSRYSVILRDLKEYEEKYTDGVPESAIHEICTKLQVDISVVLPFCEDVFIEGKSIKKRLKAFKFMNSRMDHVDLNELTSMDKPIVVSQTELDDMKKKLDETKQFYTYSKNMQKVSKISTLSGQYTTDNAFGEAVSQFEFDTGLNLCKIDDVDNADLSAFVKEGTNYNETVDFRDVPASENPEIDEHPFHKIQDLQHIDMAKAYANFKSCKYYKGFLGKITDFRCTDKVQGVGMYRVTDLVIPAGIFKTYNDKLKVYISNNVYTSAELEMLTEQGCTFSVVSGCWGVEPLDFEFNEEMLETKVHGSAYYAKWAGLCDSHRMQKTHWLKCTEKFFDVVKLNCGADVARFYSNGEASFGYTKKHNYHLGHVTAFITAYQRISVIEQLMEIPIESIVRVCVDGIYFTGKTTLKNVFRYKDDRKFGNGGSGSYVSEARKKTLLDEFGYLKEQTQKRDHFAKELHLGAGGCGKTHMNLSDYGLVRVLFVAPSWKLAVAKKRETGVNATVWARLLTDDPQQITAIKERANVLIVDEVSMLTEGQKKAIFETYSDMKIIMCGDLGFQLPCITGEEMKPTGFDNIVRHTKDMRCKDENLIYIKQTLRDMIEYDRSKSEINKWVVEQFTKLNRVLTLDEVKQKYNVEDMILSGTNANKDYITNMFPGMPKYYITDNTRLHQNGEIVIGEKPQDCKCEIRHCFTTHSIQGETAEFKLYIDSSTMFDSRMFYTAISRARKLSQIYLFNPQPELYSTAGKIYKIVSKSGTYIGSTVCELEKRFKEHVQAFKQYQKKVGKFMTSFLLLGDDDVRIELVSEYKCNSKAELWAEESRIIKAVDCVNKTYKNI